MFKSVKVLTYMAMYAALFLVLDFLTLLIPFLQMPQGGSIGIGTVALLLASYHLGPWKGLLVALVSIPLQQFTSGLWIAGIPGLMLDYILAFGIYGLACVFPSRGSFYSGILVTNIVRWMCHVVAGMVCYETPFWGSVVYNTPYMVATCVVGMILVPMLHKRLSKVL